MRTAGGTITVWETQPLLQAFEVGVVALQLLEADHIRIDTLQNAGRVLEAGHSVLPQTVLNIEGRYSKRCSGGGNHQGQSENGG